MKKLLTKIYLGYIRFWAKLQLRKINPRIIGIGGASGKSSVAHLISLILEEKYKIKKSEGKNSETGIPLNILDITPKNYDYKEWFITFFRAPLHYLTNFKKYDFYVAEMGIDSPFPPKNMSYLLKILRPDIGLLTSIALEHSVYFDPLSKNEEEEERKREILERTAAEEGLLLKSLEEGKKAIVNLDDKSIKNLLPLRASTITVSMKDKSADFYIKSTEATLEEFSMSFTFLKDEYALRIPQPLPKYYAIAFALALTASFYAGVKMEEALEILSQKFSLPPGRLSVFKGIKDTVIVDSSYNSSLEPAKGAIELVNNIAGNRRKVGILGDMRELGTLSRLQHEALARVVMKNLDYAILIGPLSLEFVAPVLKAQGFNFVAYETFRDAKTKLLGKIKQKDIILVKGSQNTLFLERAVELLLLDKKDKILLCRRGEFWDNMRNINP